MLCLLFSPSFLPAVCPQSPQGLGGRELSGDCCALANVTPDPRVPVQVSDAKGTLSFCRRLGTTGRRRRAGVAMLICWLIVEPTPFITFSDGRFNFLVFGYFTAASPDLHASFLRNRSPPVHLSGVCLLHIVNTSLTRRTRFHSILVPWTLYINADSSEIYHLGLS